MPGTPSIIPIPMPALSPAGAAPLAASSAGAASPAASVLGSEARSAFDTSAESGLAAAAAGAGLVRAGIAVVSDEPDPAGAASVSAGAAAPPRLRPPFAAPSAALGLFLF